MIDLHMHSTYSDGTQTPEQLIQEAKQLGLKAIALTDHDTIDGVDEFVRFGKQYGIIAIPGVEISVDTKLPNHGHMHILGLFIDPDSKTLREKLSYLLNQRNLRAREIIQKLKNLKVDVSLDELLEEAGEGAVGRPHVAKILLRKGIVSSIQQAFDIYLAKGKPAYMDKVKLGEKEAIGMIHEASGLAILAHPQLMNYDDFSEMKEKLLQLKELGLDGLEAYYSGLSEEYTGNLLKVAAEHDFVVSGGSDYHGSNKDDIHMGTGKSGELKVPEQVLEQLRKKRSEKYTNMTV